MTQKRTESFIPLTAAPATPERRDFRVTVVPQTAAPFEKLALPPARQTVNDTTGVRRSCEPRVSVQREGERVTGIRIQCSCGEILDLACLYGDSGRPA